MPAKMTPAQRIQGMLDLVKRLEADGFTDFGTQLLPYTTLVSADDDVTNHYRRPRAIFSYTVRQEHCNRFGHLHGGAIATMFDCGTSMAMALPLSDDDGEDGDDKAGQGITESMASWWRLGVSRTLSVTYLRPVPEGTDVLFECELVHSGKRTASLRGILRRCSDGAVLATCDHDKVIVAPPSSKI